jgi:hypothetical protein
MITKQQLFKTSIHNQSREIMLSSKMWENMGIFKIKYLFNETENFLGFLSR